MEWPLLLLLLLLVSTASASDSCTGQKVVSGSSGVIAATVINPFTKTNADSDNCSWVIPSHGGLSGVRLRFTVFDLKGRKDALSLYERSDRLNAENLRFNLKEYVPDSVTRSEFLLRAPALLQFVTDASATLSAFNVTFSHFDAKEISMATEVIRGDITNVCSHPGFRRKNPYPNNWRIAWTLLVAQHQSAMLHLIKFSTRRFDVLKIFTGMQPHLGSPVLTFSGRGHEFLQNIFYFDSTVTLVFETNFEGRGFGFTFTIYTLSVVEQSMTEPSGSVAMPLHPVIGHYQHKMDYRWLLNINGRLRFRFNFLEIEHCTDVIILYEATQTVQDSRLRYLVNDNREFNSEFVLNGPVVIRFVTGLYTQGRGFNLSYSQLPLPTTAESSAAAASTSSASPLLLVFLGSAVTLALCSVPLLLLLKRCRSYQFQFRQLQTPSQVFWTQVPSPAADGDFN